MPAEVLILSADLGQDKLVRLACGQARLEETIHLLKGNTLGLWNEEESCSRSAEGRAEFNVEAVELAGISTGEEAAIVNERVVGTVAMGGGGDACNCAGSSGMYGREERACADGEVAWYDTQRVAGQITGIPLSSPCLFCTASQTTTYPGDGWTELVGD